MQRSLAFGILAVFLHTASLGAQQGPRWGDELPPAPAAPDSLFAVPGMGRLLFDAVVNSDIPLAQGGVVVVVALAVGVTTLADFVHRFLSRTVGGTLA